MFWITYNKLHADNGSLNVSGKFIWNVKTTFNYSKTTNHIYDLTTTAHRQSTQIWMLEKYTTVSSFIHVLLPGDKFTPKVTY
jgi:hypothetical protein